FISDIDLYIEYKLIRIQMCFFFSSRRRHTRSKRDWSSDVCSSDLRTKYMLFFGIVRDYKGLDWLLKAFSRTKSQKDVKLIIAGRSEERRVGKECRSRWSR